MNVSQVGTGANFGCALAAGNVYCWGVDSIGRLGRTLGGIAGIANPQLLQMPLLGVTSLAVGNSHACALHGGVVSCWGGGAAARILGVPSPTTTSNPIAVPLPALDGEDEWAGVAAGTFHSCAWSESGRVACWGDNGRGELGRPGASARAPDFAVGIADAAGLALAQYRSCAIRDSGQVACWGDHNDAASGPAMLPVMAGAAPLADVVELAGGRFHHCAVSDPDGGGGSAYCWGADDNGQLGQLVRDSRDAAVAVPGIVDAVSVSGGHNHSCLVRSGGEVLCWGNGSAGQLADAARPDTRPPGVVGGLDATRVFGGGNLALRAFALRRDGALVCWGDNLYGSCAGGEPLYFPEAAPALGF